jgi:hypothetical protein
MRLAPVLVEETGAKADRPGLLRVMDVARRYRGVRKNLFDLRRLEGRRTIPGAAGGGHD